MGYTNYWKLTPNKNFTAEERELAYQKAIQKINKVTRALKLKEGLRLSGYTANSPKPYGGVKINGAGDDSHEDFILREHYSQNEGFGFCKTARKPYDAAVTAALIILKHYLKDQVEVSSDGLKSDWALGLEMALKYSSLKTLKIPNSIRETYERRAG